MASKKGETRQCANTNRVSMSETLRETNMKSIANSELNFHGINLSPVPQMNDIWLTSADLAKALGYASSKSVSTIYSRNSDEFTGSMSMVIKMMTNGINNNLREKSVRVFSLRGCHLIAMFATTDKAKEFRHWVLNILDREVEHSPIAKQFTDEELISLSYMWIWMDKGQRVSRAIYPAMKQIGSTYSGYFYDLGHEMRHLIEKTREMLIRETGNIDMNSFHARHAAPMLERLNGKGELH
ncbi:Phage anti-repressor protein [Serratia marcescens]|nr:Phage anti-repressor protein [Serratia marcescens]CAI2153856.1 Phage anti-repressor protein [Serratia marcescens]